MFTSALPLDRTKRWDLLGRFLRRWFPAWRAKQGLDTSELPRAEQRLGLSLPAALREWYARFGARNDVWSRQDELCMPHELRVERDVLIVCVENQDVVRWGIRLEDLRGDDPPVVVSDPRGSTTWFVECPTTSAFAAQFAAMNVKWSDAVRHRANGAGTAEAFAALDKTYARLPFTEMHWPEWPVRFYAGDDILIETHGDSWIWASVRSRPALARLDALVREAGMDEWEQYDED